MKPSPPVSYGPGDRWKWSFVGILSIPVLLGVVFFVLRPSINNDAGVGFEILQSMARGGGFNLQIQPSQEDIARDSSSFLAAWSPSQYLLPGLAQRAGFDLGHAIAVVVAACSILGLWGWWRLYRSWGFSGQVALASCLIVALTRHFSNPFYEYNGTDVILFAAAPWGALWLWNSRRQPWTVRFVVTAAVVAMLTFAKLSGIVLGGALVCGLAAACLDNGAAWTVRLFDWRRVGALAGWMLPAGLAALMVAVLVYAFWITRGWTALDHPKGAGLSLAKIYFPMVSTLVSAFSIGDAIGFLLMNPGRKLIEEPDVVYAGLLPICAVAVWYVGRVVAPRLGEVWAFIVGTCVPYLIFFIFYLAAGALYLDDRYFRPISLMMLPCLIFAAIGGRSRLFRHLTLATAVLACLYGAGSTVQHIVGIRERPVGALGFRHGFASAKLLEQLNASNLPTGAQGNGRVVYVASPELAVEVRDGRVIATVANFEALEVAHWRKFKGRARELVLYLPTTFLRNGKADAIRKAFVDYDFDKWTRSDIDDRFVRFSQ